MLSKCLNPACTASFRYLRDGRIYQLEFPSSPNSPSPFRRREYFWLCGSCCSTMTVVLRDGHGSVQSRYPDFVSGVEAEVPDPEAIIPGAG